MADRIVVLEHGRVAEAGSHEELLRLRGRYAELFDLQAAGYR
jgi:ATP-binding cassette subfamily B protein